MSDAKKIEELQEALRIALEENEELRLHLTVASDLVAALREDFERSNKHASVTDGISRANQASRGGR